MKYIYIFDYCLGHIYEIPITKEEYDTNIETHKWLYKKYHLKPDNICYMVSDKKLEIETIQKVK